MKRIIIKEDIELYAPNVFGDDKAHCYDVECHNGFAIAKRCEGEDDSLPSKLKLVYPKRKDIISDRKKSSYVLEYNGLFDLTTKDINYGDIMMCYGVIKEDKKYSFVTTK